MSNRLSHLKVKWPHVSWNVCYNRNLRGVLARDPTRAPREITWRKQSDRSVNLRHRIQCQIASHIPSARITSHELTWREDSVSPALVLRYTVNYWCLSNKDYLYDALIEITQFCSLTQLLLLNTIKIQLKIITATCFGFFHKAIFRLWPIALWKKQTHVAVMIFCYLIILFA
jgi:hypothetical protein